MGWAKSSATVLGGMCFIVGIAISSTGTEKFGMIKFDRTLNATVNSNTFIVEVQVYSGIWLTRSDTKIGNTQNTGDPSPNYCDQDEESSDCEAGRNSSCCKSLASKCRGSQACSFLAVVFSLAAIFLGSRWKEGGAICAFLTGSFRLPSAVLWSGNSHEE
eukprot:m.54873 g.54873  ORF g.54873 m.54873 type:complete len:160 (-) comp9224_c0_seq1:497-976(-)